MPDLDPRLSRRCVLFLAVAVLLLAFSTGVRADTGMIYLDLNPQVDNVVGDQIILGPSDGLSFDQPRVSIEVIDMSTGTSLGPFLEPQLPPGQTFNWYNEFLLDTGANTVMAIGAAATHFTDDFQTVGEFFELGVAGYEVFDVSDRYRFDFAGVDGQRQTLADVQFLTNPTLNFGSFYGILGMPGMVGRVTTVDLTPLTYPSFVEVTFGEGPNALPASNGHRYSIPVDTRSEYFPGYGIPEDVEGVPNTPVWAHVPFLTATMALGSETRTGSFLYDTGAQMTILSEYLTRELLGIGPEVDLWNYAIGAIPLGGIGGEITVPVVEMDEFRVMTNEDVELVWDGLQVAVHDIDEGIDGVFGHDLITSDWLLSPPGYFEQVHYDFRDFELVTREVADANFDGVVDAADAAVLAAHWLDATDRGWFDGDFNGDGVVNEIDASILAANWTGGQEGATVPEPAAWVLVLAAAALGAVVRRRRAA